MKALEKFRVAAKACVEAQGSPRFLAGMASANWLASCAALALTPAVWPGILDGRPTPGATFAVALPVALLAAFAAACTGAALAASRAAADAGHACSALQAWRPKVLAWADDGRLEAGQARRWLGAATPGAVLSSASYSHWRKGRALLWALALPTLSATLTALILPVGIAVMVSEGRGASEVPYLVAGACVAAAIAMAGVPLVVAGARSAREGRALLRQDMDRLERQAESWLHELAPARRRRT